jgi:acyl-coenzyme A synthetase/AMP-(fatty) acid ligase
LPATQTAIRSIDGSKEVSFGAVLTSARALADALKDAEISSSGGLVGLMVKCSVEGAVGMLGIVLSGAAYVPLDPAYPPKRLSQIIKGSPLSVVATAPNSAAATQAMKWIASAWPKVSTIEIALHSQEVAPLPSDESTLQRLRSYGAQHLLNLSFTSGSTGKPKGVAYTHAGTLAQARFFTSKFPFRENEGIINHITYGWEDHKRQVWPPLLLGKELIVVPDTEALLGMVGNPPRNVHQIWAVPTLLDAMFSVLEQKDGAMRSIPDFLSLVIASGEPLTEALIQRYRSLVPDGTIVSSFGLSETQGETSVAVYGPSRLLTGRVSMGSPHWPYAYAVRSPENGEWLGSSAGEQGELFIASPLILDGYYRRPDGVRLADDAANARFALAPSEFKAKLEEASNISTDRAIHNMYMYQTGDLVAYREDGEMEHVGRCDDQVKVNGVRIELGHVATSTLKCQGVAMAHATAARDGNDGLRIVVFVSGPAASSSAALMSELSTHLPSVYMPSALVVLPEGLPQLPNGKINRKKLFALAMAELGEGAPSDSISRLVAGQGTENMPGWHFVCLHFTFLAILSMLVAHIRMNGAYFFLDNSERPGSHAWVSWGGVGMDINHATLLAMFASGYVDTVAAPPRNWRAIVKRLGIVLLFYLAYQPFSVGLNMSISANMWPVLLLLVYRTIVWSTRLLVTSLGAPAWIAMALLGIPAIGVSAVCPPWGGEELCILGYSNDFVSSWVTLYSFPPIVQGVLEDVRQLIWYNVAITLFPAYVLYPTIIEAVWPKSWKRVSTSTPMKQENQSDDDLIEWVQSSASLLFTPAIYRRLLAFLYIVAYHVVLTLTTEANTQGWLNLTYTLIPREVFTVGFMFMQLMLCTSLFLLLPSHETSFSKLGASALTAYVVYLGFMEPFVMLSMGDAVRFVNAPYAPAVELVLLGLVGLLAYVGGAFAFALSEPLSTNPGRVMRKILSRGGFLQSARLPVLRFPCGFRCFLLAWFVFFAIPPILQVPSHILIVSRPTTVMKKRAHWNHGRWGGAWHHHSNATQAPPNATHLALHLGIAHNATHHHP